MRRSTRFSKKHKNGAIIWRAAPDVKKRILHLISKLQLDFVHKSKIICFRSVNAKTRAYARIWGLGRIWQQALNIPPSYIIEVISEKYDKLGVFEKDKVLLHEITHIPSNFSGSLIPHIRRGKGRFEDKVERLIFQYLKGRL